VSEISYAFELFHVKQAEIKQKCNHRSGFSKLTFFMDLWIYGFQGHPIKFLSQIFLSIIFLKSTPQDLSKMPKYLQIG
jgi:hypothetical protein